jgi:selenocysteine lyase/cysteine desulfurase
MGWGDIRRQFGLDPHAINLTAWLLASHPRPVHYAIERHRAALNRNARLYLDQHEGQLEVATRVAAGEYLGVSRDEVALTDSTTMALGLLYGGLRLRPGQELLTTTHDFYSTHEALRLRAERDGATLHKATLYRRPDRASVDEILSSSAA